MTPRPPQRPNWMLSAPLLNCSLGIPSRAIRTMAGRGRNRPSLRATPPCATSFLAGRHPYQPTFFRSFLHISAPPSRRFGSLLTKADHTPPTTASSCSSVNRLSNPRLTRSARWDTWLLCSCRVANTRTLRMLERFYWWNGMNNRTRWWLRHCQKCRARKTSQLTVRQPIMPMPLPEGPDNAVSIEYVGHLSVTPRGNTYILLFTDRFSRRPDMFAVTAAKFAAGETDGISINLRYSPLGMPSQYTPGQWPPRFLKAFTCRLQASWGSENCHQLLPPK